MKATISLLASGLGPGETIREVCPTCDGGSQREKSLAITRKEDDSLVWVCHRATCPSQGRGGTSSASGSLIKVAETKVAKRKKFDSETRPLSKEHLERIEKLWGITEPPHWYHAPTYNRVAMSIRSPKYLHRGWMLRDIWGTKSVKALTYLEEDEEALSWYMRSPHAPTVLVEDIPSSVRASTYINAVSLLGTGMGLSKAAEIAKYAPRPIIVALDQDVTGKSYQMAQRYNLLWGDVRVMPIPKDLKDMTEDELKQQLEQGASVTCDVDTGP